MMFKIRVSQTAYLVFEIETENREKAIEKAEEKFFNTNINNFGWELSHDVDVEEYEE